jgi:hypothetical protein
MFFFKGGFCVQEDSFQPVYDEVGEEEYSEIVRQRQKDDWIEDGGLGGGCSLNCG